MARDNRLRSPQPLKFVQYGPFLDGVNEIVEPHLLKKSELSNADNTDFDTSPGKIIKRPAVRYRADLSASLTAAPKNAFTFITSDGKEILLMTDNNKLIKTEDGETFEVVKDVLNNDVTLNPSGFLRFAQGQNKVWMTNKLDAVMSMDSAGTLIKHDKTIVSSEAADDRINPKNSFSSVTYKGTKTLVLNELTGKVFVMGARDDQPTVSSGIQRIVTGNTATLAGETTISFAQITGSGEHEPNTNWAVGVQIPKASALAFHFETMFESDTENNSLEIRFTDLVDPNNPEFNIQADHPFAWPAVNQLTAEAGIGDRIWGFTPIYRNRLAVMKEVGLFRIDPDPTVKFILSNFSMEAGSRFPDTWIEQNNVLKFLGARRDQLPDIFRTDFVSVRDYERKHSVTLDQLKQASQLFKSHVIGTQVDWNDSNKSTLTKTSGNMLQVGSIDLDTERYEANVLPENDTPSWVSVSAANVTTTVTTELRIDKAGGGGSKYLRKRSNVLDQTKDTLIQVKAKAETIVGSVEPAVNFGAWNGAFAAWVVSKFRVGNSDQIFLNDVELTHSIDVSAFHVYTLLLKKDGSAKLWVDGTLIGTATVANAKATEFNKSQFGIGTVSGDPATDDEAFIDTNLFGETFTFDFVYFIVNPIYFSETEAGWEFPIDYKKAISDNPSLHSFGRYYVDKSEASASFQLSSKSSVDDSTYSSYENFTSGQEPAVDNSTPVRRYMKVRITGDFLSIKSITGGMLHIAKPIFIGKDISAWLSFQMTHFNWSPGMRIRRSTQDAEPDELSETGWDTALAGSDAEGWIIVASGDSLETIFGEAPGAITTTWVQVLHEGDLDVWPEVSAHASGSLSINWLEGATEILPIFARSFKKKYMLVGATAGSAKNDIMIVLDKNEKFANWTGINFNFLLWFKGELFAGKADDTDTLRHLLNFTQSFKSDRPILGADVPITANVETKQDTMGSIVSRKKLRYLEAVCNAENSSITFSYKKDGDSAFATIGTVNFTATLKHKRLHFPIGVQVKRVIFKAENSALNEDFGLETLIVGYEHIPSMSGL